MRSMKLIKKLGMATSEKRETMSSLGFDRVMTRDRMIQSLKGRALRHFTLSTGKSAGRNSSGRITVFHRGGGSKRLQRKKRSTSSIGIVERIEYDPNRSSRIVVLP
jgi:ribosomal protein L2